MSYYASAWTPMPYASTTRYAFGQDPSCDSAAEGVSGASAGRSASLWSSVTGGGDLILTAQSGSTYSGASSCDPASYNEGYLGSWQLACVTHGGQYSETADGYQCHIPSVPGGGGGGPYPSPSPSPSPTPVPDADTSALSSAAPLFIAGALVVGILAWKVFT